MKTRQLCNWTISTFVLLITAQAAFATPISAGRMIGIDIGSTFTTNWNNFSTDSTIAGGSVVDLTGTVVDGVAIATSNGQFYNTDGTDNWGGLAANGGSLPPEFVDSVVTDIGGNFSLGDGVPFTVTITGLSTALTYNLVAVTTAGLTPIDTITVIGAVASAPSAISRPTTLASPWPFHSFTGIAPTAGGTITIQVVDTSDFSNPILNGVLITAVPEPNSLTMLAFGMLSLWLFRSKK
jgi:hypothetical protein